jgi:hypothetical protein
MKSVSKTLLWSGGLLAAAALLLPGCEERPPRDRERPAAEPALPAERDPFMQDRPEAWSPAEDLPEAQPPVHDPAMNAERSVQLPPLEQPEPEIISERRVIDVALYDDRIDMPSALPIGIAVFRVTNRGEQAQGFAIEGAGVDERLEQVLQPGESATLAISLEPGAYRAFSPELEDLEMVFDVNVD